MRPLRDWAYKKLESTSDNLLDSAEAMMKEEAEEVKDLLRDYPGLKGYLAEGKTPQDFINEFGTFNWDIRFCQFRLVWEHWVRKQNPVDVTNIESATEALDIIQESNRTIKVPEDLAWRLYSPDIPEEYRNWGFAVYFTDNDFGLEMEILGDMIGKRYLEEIKEITKTYFLYEDIIDVSIEDMCKTNLEKYFNQERLSTLLDVLYPAAYYLTMWRHRKGEIDSPEEVERVRNYLDLKNRQMKIGSLQEIKSWMINDLGCTEEDGYIWCNSEVLIVYIEDGKLNIKVQ